MKKAKNYLLIASISVAVLLIAGFILAGIFDKLLDVLYISLIVLAAFSLISTALLVYLLLTLIGSVTTVRNEMKPLLASVNQTVTSVRGSVEETLESVKGTARSASHTASTIGATAQLTNKAVGPTVRVAALVVAGREAVRIFVGKGHTRRRHEERRKQQMVMMDAAGGGE